MSFFEWNDKYSVGDAAIDADHKGLFDLIRELENANLTDGYLAEIIGRLEDYAAEHFAREEMLMKSMNYPDFDEHVKKHRAFVEWLETVKTTYRRAAESPFQIGDMVNHFLESWLTNHIMKDDMKYRDFMSEH